MNDLDITQEEYVNLRGQGLSKEDIVNKYSKQQVSLGQRAMDVGSAVTNFLGGKKVAETFGAEIARARAGTQEEKNTISAGAPTIGETAGSAFQLAANILPATGIASKATGLAGRALGIGNVVRGTTSLAPIRAGVARAIGTVAPGASLGYALDVGRNLEQGATGAEALKPGVGTVTGGVMSGLSGIIGYSVGKAGAASRKLEEISLRLTPTERQNLQRKGQDIAKYLSEKKIVGSPEARYAKVNTLYDQMETRVGNEIKNAGIKFSKTKLINELQQIPDSFKNDPELQNEAQTAISALIKNLKNRKESFIPGEIVQELKRNYMKRAFAKNATDVISDTRLAIGGYLKGRLDDYVPKLKGMNKEYGLLIASNRALQKAISRPQIGLVGKLVGGAVGASVGGVIGGPVGVGLGAAIGPQFGRVVAGTQVRSRLGAGLQGVSNMKSAIDKLPVKAGNISLKAVLDIVEKFRE